jgi:hypothetical protein
LTYFHYAANEAAKRCCTEINRMRAVADALRERYRAQYNAPADDYYGPEANNIAFEEAQTTVINGRHRRRDEI